MAKKIREMAIQYAPHPTNNNWNEMQKQLVKLSAYEAGANAVLEEIESCYDKNDSLCVIAHKIQSKIIELKGE